MRTSRSVFLPLQKETLPLRPHVCRSLHLSGNTFSKISRLFKTMDRATPLSRSTRDRTPSPKALELRFTARIRWMLAHRKALGEEEIALGLWTETTSIAYVRAGSLLASMEKRTVFYCSSGFQNDWSFNRRQVR